MTDGQTAPFRLMRAEGQLQQTLLARAQINAGPSLPLDEKRHHINCRNGKRREL